MIKEMKHRGKYFIISNDEPYIEKLYEVFKKGLSAKGGRHANGLSFMKAKKPELDKLRA